jgi:hypothetical protein
MGDHAFNNTTVPPYPATCRVAVSGTFSREFPWTRAGAPPAGVRPPRPDVSRQVHAARRSSGRGAYGPAWFREDFATLIELLREGKIHPVVAERLLSDARRAHEMLESSASKGKLVLVPEADGGTR